MARLLEEQENSQVIAELQEKAEREYPRLHGEEDFEEYLAALIDVAAAEITKLRAQVEALREEAGPEKPSENSVPLPPYVLELTKRPRATVPKAMYDAQTRECEIKTGVIKQLVRENEIKQSIISGFQRFVNGFWRIESCSPEGEEQ